MHIIQYSMDIVCYFEEVDDLKLGSGLFRTADIISVRPLDLVFSNTSWSLSVTLFSLIHTVPLMEDVLAKYTVIVRDQIFTLYKTQIDFDAPNYFTAYFLGDFAEGASGKTTLTLDRNPSLFAILIEYMSGYHILPLAETALPRTMDKRAALKNLAEDAAFYGLSRLHAMLTEPVQPSIDFGWTGFSGKVIQFEDVLRGKLPDSVSYTTSGLCSIESGSVRPVIIFAQSLALKWVFDVLYPH